MSNVFITGATGGIGVPTVRMLAGQGHRVFAGVRDHSLARAFDDLAGVVPVQVDVTDEASVAAAAKAVAAQLGADSLDAVVNNAGIIVQGPLELVEGAELERQLRVNVLGPATVIRAFLPLLRPGPGRIVNVSAPTARRAVPLMAPISASKAALESLSVALRGELAPWGIKVVIVEPTATDTPIFARARAAAEESLERADPQLQRMYAPSIDAADEAAAKMTLADPDSIAKVLVTAVTTARPRTLYTAGRGAGMLPMVGRLPDPLADAIIARAIGIAGVQAG
ncbi:SDR family NAD(P)-dependent oxidoreductase [Nocardioides luteus]|uniref:SDR family NAD(P)-dependent oxidoreductase n=1 Tax=Nocardioides luteus TaxID=1844 RepID=UPI0018CB444A|nr:SDR family NAD(P)-dependent oxidoreductase [Nocardioides luteus]MBG6098066.1 NAD(P)-dependent dehydrogenase (short-subunit alcohol dehydrogenase family) [Nocardioides luteus]